MAIFEDQLISKGLIISLSVIALTGYAVHKIVTSQPEQALPIFKEMLPYFGMIVTFYLGSRTKPTATQ